MHPPPDTVPDLLNDLSGNLPACGQLALPDANCQIAFEIDIIPRECPPQVYFGLVEAERAGNQRLRGFVVRLDLGRGEVWDALNGGGPIGTLETGPLGLDRYDDEEPLLLSLRVDKCGSNLLPTLRIGGVTFLYPAFHSNNCKRLAAFSAVSQPGRDAPPFCHFPALWMTSAA